jgi:biotin carboxylase
VDRILIPSPTRRDLLNLADPRLHARFDLVFEEQPGIDGVFGSSDSTAALAVVVADRLGLPGPGYDAFMRCHDKLVCRRICRQAVPEVTPAFAPVDAHRRWDEPPLPFPFFLKPVQGHLSQHAYRIDSASDLDHALGAARAAGFRNLIAEELLTGPLVTFEGFIAGGQVTPVGVTDAVLHPNEISFMRFEYPSVFPAGLQNAMAGIAHRLMPALGFDGSLFNIEFFVQPDGSLRIVEVNGRMASQFAPLVRAVHGVSTYELGMELAAGGRPALPPRRPGVVAASVLIRYWEDGIVRGLPDPMPLLERFPGVQIELLVRHGQRLSENDDDTASHRLAVIALSGASRRELVTRAAEAAQMLEFEIETTAQKPAEHQGSRSP